MKVSQQWLRRYIDLDRSREEIEEALTLIGFEVEGVEEIGLPLLDKVVVGEVLTSEPHPNADRLTVCEVSVSEGGETKNIVCGAKNYQVGDRVPVALAGSLLPGNFKIKKSKLRGVVSDGMMCSARELQLGDDHRGLLILEDRPAVGTPINEVFPETDLVFDIEVTPNRPDCLSHLGIARELSARFGLPLDFPQIVGSSKPAAALTLPPLLDKMIVEIPQKCPHYRAYCIWDVKIGPSPQWMRRLLKSAGLRPINNVVDITNFVLLELGQPLHTFDASKIRRGKLVIRQAGRGEEIVTLDDKRRTLAPPMTVIADAERALVVAGIMGSIDAEVDDSTTNLVLEAAYFNPSNIRSTSRRLNLVSDSSYRFARGVDPKGTEFAALRAIDLILEIAGGKLEGPPFVVGEPPLMEREIEIGPRYIRSRLGFDVEDASIGEVFEALGLYVQKRRHADGSIYWNVGIPSFRLDLERPIDLVEEFLRIYGTDKIPTARPVAPGLLHKDDPVDIFKRKSASYLCGRHFNECLNYSMRSAEEVDLWFSHAAASTLQLANPLASDQSHLRPSLIPCLLDSLRLNRYRGNSPLRLFETGNVWRERDGRLWELFSVAFLMVQDSASASGQWIERQPPDFFQVAGIVRNLLRLAGAETDAIPFEPIQTEDSWQEGHAASICDYAMGCQAKAGILNYSMLKKWDIEGTVLAGAVYLRPAFLRNPRSRPSHRPISQYPPITKDLALVVDESLFAENVNKALESAAREAAAGDFTVESINVFDVYRGKGLPEGKKSLAFNLVFRSLQRTLTDEEVNRAFDAIQKSIVAGGYAIRQ